jgi:hypothetical protein
MLLRLALLASAFSALILAAEPPATPVFSGKLFPNQDKNLTQLTRQAFDNQLRATVVGNQAKSDQSNPTRLPPLASPQKPNPLTSPWQLSRAFPAITGQRTTCVVPLLEAKVKPTHDSISTQTPKTNIDKMAIPTPLPVCKNSK